MQNENIIMRTLFKTIIITSLLLFAIFPRYKEKLTDAKHRNFKLRKGIRRIWQLPYTTHSVLLPVLGDTLPLLDLFFVCMLSFVHRYLRSESPLINFMVCHRILYGQMDSIIGRNVSQCSFRYNVGLHNIINLHIRPCDLISYSRSRT